MEEKFTTKDLYLSAAFIALGAKYVGADKKDPRHMEFQFEKNSSVDLLAIYNAWVNGSLMVNAVDFKNAIQQMKAVVHSDF